MPGKVSIQLLKAAVGPLNGQYFQETLTRRKFFLLDLQFRIVVTGMLQNPLAVECSLTQVTFGVTVSPYGKLTVLDSSRMAICPAQR